MKNNFEDIDVRQSVIGLFLHLISFSIFIYADILIFKYPASIVMFRLLTMLICVVALSVYFMPKTNQYFKRVFLVNMFMTLLFTNFVIHTLMTTNSPFVSRGFQAYAVIVVGELLFAGVCRKELRYVLSINFFVLLVVLLICNNYNVEAIFINFNTVFLTIMTIVFNEIYNRTKLNQEKTMLLLNSKNHELEQEIETRKHLEKKLATHANHDELTGFYSRREGLRIMSDMFDFINFSVAYVDLDNLKVFNDSLGHKCGDEYILKLKEAIIAKTRGTDVITRVGGDEFVILFPREDKSSSEDIMRRIQRYFNSEKICDSDFRLDFSWGVVECCKERHISIDSVIEEADKEMYKRKVSKRKPA